MPGGAGAASSGGSGGASVASGTNGNAACHVATVPAPAPCLYTTFENGVNPETTATYDIGYRFTGDWLSASITAWNTQYRNRIVTTYDPDQGISIDHNIGKVSFCYLIKGDKEGKCPVKGFVFEHRYMKSYCSIALNSCKNVAYHGFVCACYPSREALLCVPERISGQDHPPDHRKPRSLEHSRCPG